MKPMKRIFILFAIVAVAGFYIWQYCYRLLPHGDLGLFISTGKMITDPALAVMGKNKTPLTPEAARTMVMQFKDSDGLLAFQNSTSEKWKLPIHASPISLGLITNWSARGFRTVAYFQVFKDKAFVDAYSTEGITDGDGKIFGDKYGAFVDPSSEKYRDYFFSIIEEVLPFHPDEIMLDYIRFPEYSGLIFPLSKVSENDIPAKEKIITEFVKQLHVFIKAKSPTTQLSCAIFPPHYSIGQNYQGLAANLDIISPMVYPNIFSGTVGGNEWKASFDEMVGSVKKEMANTQITIRPFLQGFQFFTDASSGKRKTKHLEADLMRYQIQKMQNLGWGYLMFSASSSYSNVWAVLK